MPTTGAYTLGMRGRTRAMILSAGFRPASGPSVTTRRYILFILSKASDFSFAGIRSGVYGYAFEKAVSPFERTTVTLYEAREAEIVGIGTTATRFPSGDAANTGCGANGMFTP